MLHILYGGDGVSRKEAFERLKAGLDPDGALATNTTHLYAARSSPQEVTAACDTVPFLGEHRLVVLEGLLALAARRGRRGGGDEGEEGGAEEEPPPDAGRWAPLADYVPNMQPSTTLVVLDNEVAASNALLKRFGPLGEVQHFTVPKDRDLPGWVMARAKSSGLKIDGPAARLLAELIGPDTWTLTSEIEKLGAYANGETLRESDVRDLVGRAKEQKGYFLTDAVLEGQGARAARLLQELIEDGAVLAVVLATLANRYRRLAVAKELMERGAPGGEISRRTGVGNTFALDRLLEQAARLSWPGIHAAYDRIIQAERDHKSGLMDEQVAIELLVQELASRPSPRAASGH